MTSSLERFFTCDLEDCELPSVRGFGPYDAFEANVHTEVKNLRAKINDEAVCQRASELNGNMKCEIEHPPPWGRGALMGWANYHARIRFESGVVWLMRVPRTNGSLPQKLIDYLIRSEYATLKFLESTQVPAPRVFDYATAEQPDNKIGVSYIFMEEMPGKPWNQQGSAGKEIADNEDKEKIWSGLADILIELERYPFSKGGSLLPGSSGSCLEPVVGALASERFLVLSPDGPYDTANEYYTAFMEQNMVLIADGQLFTSFPVNAYLIFLYLKSQIDTLTETQTPAEEPETTEKFYIKHVDDKGDHIMVDDELNIVGIIDWQMARVVPANEAFGPSLVTAEMSDIYDGISSLTVQDQALARLLREKGAGHLADIMSKDERLRRFFFGLDVDFPWEDTLLLIRGIWTAFGVGRDIEWKTWKIEMLEQHVEDERLKEMIEKFGVGP
ncbi:uncharacterized protein N7483_011737 [Penicillium malachiteum]|uniref:uncharacterized protein n=1 Tax=Penicillium malachiteum TaxID=1324776 RepID=UPI002548DADC|nr:uncharacterized protein N7483_011737 [Penicillium malachiteum]KAJ5714556.1 hypothetical protein N7483_011737 [Penicillium malachiteum]